MKRILPILAALAAVLVTGCTSIKKTADGWSYSNGLFWKKADSIELIGGTNGTYAVRVKGYQSDADQIVGLAREAIALGKAATPAP